MKVRREKVSISRLCSRNENISEKVSSRELRRNRKQMYAKNRYVTGVGDKVCIKVEL